MNRYVQQVRQAIRKGDWILLLLCIITTAYGCLIIASATNYLDSYRYIVMQIVGAVIGIILFALVSSVDVEFMMEQRLWLVLFNVLILFMLIPFGETINGNRSWVNFPFLPFNIQVAEICKITYILIMAKEPEWCLTMPHKHMSAHLNTVFLGKIQNFGINVASKRLEKIRIIY